MLAQLLKREFMLQSMRTLNHGMLVQAEGYAQADPDVLNLMTQAEVDVDDLRVAHEEFEAAIERETVRGTDDLADAAFFPRDPVVSLAQSALQEFCEEKKPDRIVRNTVRRARGAQQIAVTDRQIDPSLAALLTGNSARGLLGKYQLMDIGWANCLAASVYVVGGSDTPLTTGLHNRSL